MNGQPGQLHDAVSRSSALRNSALRLLARREHSAQELAGKLASRHSLSPAASEIRQLLADLEQAGYLSNTRFVESFVRERRNRGYGPVRIAQELRLRGIDTDTAEACLDRHDPGWQAVAQAVRRKRFGELPASQLKDKARIARFLQYRGFLQEQIDPVL